ncbi:hypothetical protein [Methylovulum psychrotolerans]|uniref:Uncharacterized protein n=1 Tax=Methylovulum psychrotolerans TaxID=1704499 RepID=A0A2S5CN65_9GAMM|nr:hypothetical protein [Methylovulum psychrotolerans]POZ52216.1 hypothetical protein AADEFJLK_01689 [Methylovulum psychrotolerans]
MKYNYGWCLLAVAVQMAHAGNIETYNLPASKVYQGYCRQEALRLHPGVIAQQRLLHSNGEFLLRNGIQAGDGSEWFVVCDLANGNIIREQKLADGKI